MLLFPTVSTDVISSNRRCLAPANVLHLPPPPCFTNGMVPCIVMAKISPSGQRQQERVKIVRIVAACCYNATRISTKPLLLPATRTPNALLPFVVVSKSPRFPAAQFTLLIWHFYTEVMGLPARDLATTTMALFSRMSQYHRYFGGKDDGQNLTLLVIVHLPSSLASLASRPICSPSPCCHVTTAVDATSPPHQHVPLFPQVSDANTTIVPSLSVLNTSALTTNCPPLVAASSEDSASTNIDYGCHRTATFRYATLDENPPALLSFGYELDWAGLAQLLVCTYQVRGHHLGELDPLEILDADLTNVKFPELKPGFTVRNIDIKITPGPGILPHFATEGKKAMKSHDITSLSPFANTSTYVHVTMDRKPINAILNKFSSDRDETPPARDTKCYLHANYAEDPIVLGKARTTQHFGHDEKELNTAMGLLLHGDATLLARELSTKPWASTTSPPAVMEVPSTSSPTTSPLIFHLNGNSAKAVNSTIEDGQGIDWATAEALTFGLLTTEKAHVQVSGQVNKHQYVTLNKIDQSQARFVVCNSSGAVVLVPSRCKSVI
ncbi:hypothetical protein NMY22_g393 [Coprinellus aureogranulatus]|nr:hypothetical protein NMY22_g393 [Coprinellus aureogranulatus]